MKPPHDESAAPTGEQYARKHQALAQPPDTLFARTNSPQEPDPQQDEPHDPAHPDQIT